jgi:hypothetical protein
MEDLFSGIADCSIIIMDGILIGATDYADAYKKYNMSLTGA